MCKANNLNSENGSQMVHKQSTIYKATSVLSNSRITLIAAALMISILLSGCAAKYKSSWSCKNPEGIGCSNIYYADQIARKHIILNEDKKTGKALTKRTSKESVSNPLATSKRKNKKVLIREHYSDFEKVKRQEVEID